MLAPLAVTTAALAASLMAAPASQAINDTPSEPRFGGTINVAGPPEAYDPSTTTTIGMESDASLRLPPTVLDTTGDLKSAPIAKPEDIIRSDQGIQAEGIAQVKCAGKVDWYRIFVYYDNSRPLPGARRDPSTGAYCFARTKAGSWSVRINIPHRAFELCPGNNGGRTKHFRWGDETFEDAGWGIDRPWNRDPRQWVYCFEFDAIRRVIALNLHD